MTADKSRRIFLRQSVAALIALPGLVMAQAPLGVRRVAFLSGSNSAAMSHRVKALVDGLSELGWVEGRNLRLDIRYAEADTSRYRPLAAELLAQRPDVFIAGTEPVAWEAAAVTKTVPIVFTIGYDPVGSGLVQSLARPGGNVTGFTVLNYELMPKRLTLLKEAVPGLTRVAVIYRMGDANADRVLKSLAEPARTLGLTIIPGGVRDAGGLEQAFEQIVRQKAEGILHAPDSFFFLHATRVMDLAIKHRLYSGSTLSEYARAGALFSYGPDASAVYRRSATLVDKILKGAKPATIPVEQPNLYEMVVNLKTARLLGIKLPHSILIQATQTIE